MGYDQPDGWLTTQMARSPGATLLDEVEKTHPAVWMTMLQVFDAGRLTDARAKTVDFGDTVILMTSNLGSEAFAGRSVGVGAGAESTAGGIERSVRRTIEQAMAPELVNRLDDIIVFNQLNENEIEVIAERELSAVKERLSDRYGLELSAAAVRHIAVGDYDKRYGARHLHRAIERKLLQPLV